MWELMPPDILIQWPELTTFYGQYGNNISKIPLNNQHRHPLVIQSPACVLVGQISKLLLSNPSIVALPPNMLYIYVVKINTMYRLVAPHLPERDKIQKL